MPELDPQAKLVAGQTAIVAAEGGWLFRPGDQIVAKGADRVRFLNGQLTCDLKTPAPPALAYGYFTSGKGRVESDVLALIEPERLRLLLPPGQGEPMLARLRKYLIADRVELALGRIAGRWVIGPARGLESRGIPMPEKPFQVATGGGSSWLRLPGLGLAGELACLVEIGGDDGPPPPCAALAGLAEIAEATYQQLRIEAGRAELGADFGPDHFPQEIGVEEAVSYTKGCYLGQEVVARIHYRGGVQRQLRRLELEAQGELPEGPIHLRYEGSEVGKLTSRAPLPRGGKVLGLGILHKKAEPGAHLEATTPTGEPLGAARIL